MSFSSINWTLDWLRDSESWTAFYKLSYPVPARSGDFFPNKQHYGKGWADAQFIIGWAILFAVLREILMRGFLMPFMRWWLSRSKHRRSKMVEQANGVVKANGHDKSLSNGNGHVVSEKDGQTLRSRSNTKEEKEVGGRSATPKTERQLASAERMEKKVVRFAEQGWSVAYYIVYWTFGVYITVHSPWYPFDLDQLWIGWPDNQQAIPGLLKFYYLTQLAFWFNQLVVINIEAKRKDYSQMMIHHVITTTLMLMSYFENFTRVGSLVLVLFDFCDILLPLAKVFKYMGLEPLPDITFGLFLFAWLISRQVMFPAVILSVIRDSPRLIPLSEGEMGTHYSKRSYLIFSGLLCSLEVLSLMWLFMIGRVAWGVVMGQPAEDTRSDDED